MLSVISKSHSSELLIITQILNINVLYQSDATMGKEYKPGAKIQVSTSSDSPNVNTPPFGFKWYQFFNLVSDDGYPSNGVGKA